MTLELPEWNAVQAVPTGAFRGQACIVLPLQGHPSRRRFTERTAMADGLAMHFLESQVWNRARRYVRAMRRVISAFGSEPGACKGAGTGSVKLPRRLLDSALQRGQQGPSRATSARVGR